MRIASLLCLAFSCIVFSSSVDAQQMQQRERQFMRTSPLLGDPLPSLTVYSPDGSEFNRLKHALGDRPNSEIVIDPDGIIVRKRAWSHPAQVRKDLEELVGPVERITREEDVQLALTLPKQSTAPRGVVPRIERPKMQAIVMEPAIDPDGQPFFAKLRAEVDDCPIGPRRSS